jgi:diaminopimelate decarboxylase
MRSDGGEGTSEVIAVTMEYRQGELEWYGQNLSRMTSRLETPLYVISRQALQRSVRDFLVPFEESAQPVKIHYSVKTNPVPGFLRLLEQEGVGVEVISECELDLVESLGFPPQEIIVNGPSKSIKTLRRVIQRPVKMVTIESGGEFSRLCSVARGAGMPVNVGLRICPGLQSGRWDPTLNSGAKHSPYGFIPNSRELWEILAEIKKNRSLRLVGFHLHLGSGIKDSRPYKKAFSILEKVVTAVRQLGFQPQLLDIGGGFGTASSPVYSFPQLAMAAVCKKPPAIRESGRLPLLNEVAQGLARLISRLKRSGVVITEVVTEPGRIISGPVQIVILTVLDVIERKKGERFLICDGGAMSLSPLLLTEFHRILPLSANGGKWIEYTLLGNLPSQLDKLSLAAVLPRAAPGDRLALLDAGAYFVPFNNNFAGPRPGILLIDEEGPKLIRRRETFQEVFQRDLMERN